MFGILTFKYRPSPETPRPSWGVIQDEGETLFYQSTQTHRRTYRQIWPGDVWACHTTTPPHDNTYGGVIIHRPT